MAPWGDAFLEVDRVQVIRLKPPPQPAVRRMLALFPVQACPIPHSRCTTPRLSGRPAAAPLRSPCPPPLVSNGGGNGGTRAGTGEARGDQGGTASRAIRAERRAARERVRSLPRVRAHSMRGVIRVWLRDGKSQQRSHRGICALPWMACGHAPMAMCACAP